MPRLRTRDSYDARVSAEDEEILREWREGGEGEFFEAVTEYKHATPGEPKSGATKRLNLAISAWLQADRARKHLLDDDDGGSATTVPG
jgi:hypothetical protein